MKNTTRWINSVVLIVLFAVIAMSEGLAAPTDQPGGLKYDKAKYKRIGVLVTRTGGLGLETPTLKTDYANRDYKNKKNLYIEDEARLREAFPEYPLLYSEKRGGLFRFVSECKYYKNITPQIGQSITGMLIEKGYQVIDIRQISKTWPKPIAEMTLTELTGGLKGSVDALLVVHYTDIGDAYYDDQHMLRVQKGPSALSVTAAMFDVVTGESLLPFRTGYNISVRMLLDDQEILANSETTKKIRKIYNPNKEFTFERGFSEREWEGILTTVTKVTVFDFTEEEILEYMLKRLRKGWDGSKAIVKWEGLEKVIP